MDGCKNRLINSQGRVDAVLSRRNMMETRRFQLPHSPTPTATKSQSSESLQSCAQVMIEKNDLFGMLLDSEHEKLIFYHTCRAEDHQVLEAERICIDLDCRKMCSLSCM